MWRGVQNCTAASSPNIFRFGGTSCTRNYSSRRFIFAQPNGSTGIAVPAGSSDATLTFAHRRQFETGYDGGLVALSLNNSSYTVVPASAIVSGAYVQRQRHRRLRALRLRRAADLHRHRVVVRDHRDRPRRGLRHRHRRQRRLRRTDALHRLHRHHGLLARPGTAGSSTTWRSPPATDPTRIASGRPTQRRSATPRPGLSRLSRRGGRAVFVPPPRGASDFGEPFLSGVPVTSETLALSGCRGTR